MDSIENLILLARRYGEALGLELSTVSWRVFGDTKKLGAIISGADIQLKRYQRAMQWFSDHWPPETEWPADITRPAPAKAESAA